MGGVFQRGRWLPGCTDPMDVAYNPWAVTDEGCEGWSVAGCTYSQATNYSANANDDDGTCIFEQGSACRRFGWRWQRKRGRPHGDVGRDGQHLRLITSAKGLRGWAANA